MGDEPKVIEFDQCPVCGSKERLAGELAKKAKKKGQVREELGFFAGIVTGMIKDPLMEHKLLIGSNIPAYRIFWDVCLLCGIMYAVKVEISYATKGVGPKPQQRQPPDNMPFLKG